MTTRKSSKIIATLAIIPLWAISAFGTETGQHQSTGVLVSVGDIAAAAGFDRFGAIHRIDPNGPCAQKYLIGDPVNGHTPEYATIPDKNTNKNSNEITDLTKDQNVLGFQIKNGQLTGLTNTETVLGVQQSTSWSGRISTAYVTVQTSGQYDIAVSISATHIGSGDYHIEANVAEVEKSSQEVTGNYEGTEGMGSRAHLDSIANTIYLGVLETDTLQDAQFQGSDNDYHTTGSNKTLFAYEGGLEAGTPPAGFAKTESNKSVKEIKKDAIHSAKKSLGFKDCENDKPEENDNMADEGDSGSSGNYEDESMLAQSEESSYDPNYENYLSISEQADYDEWAGGSYDSGSRMRVDLLEATI